MSDDDLWDETVDWNAISASYRSPPRPPPASSSTPTQPASRMNRGVERIGNAGGANEGIRVRHTGSTVAPMRRSAPAPASTTGSTSTSVPVRRAVASLEANSKRTTQPAQSTGIGTSSTSNIANGKRNRDSSSDGDDVLDITLAETNARPNKKAILYESPSKHVRNALEAFDDELSCPICLDILVEPRTLNPCGHSTCGGCIVSWLQKSKTYPPTCPTCRMKLSSHIPNVTVKNMVHKHVEMMRSSKAVDWLDKGAKYKDFRRREKENQEMLKADSKAAPSTRNPSTGNTSNTFVAQGPINFNRTIFMDNFFRAIVNGPGPVIDIPSDEDDYDFDDYDDYDEEYE